MVLRIFWNLGSGIVHHALAKKPKPGVGVLYPIVWRGRTGLLDCDANMHLNNASYLYSMELARWHFAGAIGMIPTYIKNGQVFLVAANTIRYRQPIPPFAAYEIHTRMVYWDDDSVYFLQQFVSPKTGQIYAEGVCRGTVKQGRKRVPMREIYRDATGFDGNPDQTLSPVVVEFINWTKASKSNTERAELEFQEEKKVSPPAKTPWRKLAQSWNNPFRASQHME